MEFPITRHSAELTFRGMNLVPDCKARQTLANRPSKIGNSKVQLGLGSNDPDDWIFVGNRDVYGLSYQLQVQ